MDLALNLVILAVVVTIFSDLARRLAVPAPLMLLVVGFGVSYVPFVPNVELTPELVLFGLLPPLLYAAALSTSLIEFRRNTRPIALLSVGLVIFTAFGVGLLLWWLLPVPFAAAVALGAVVSPPDPVAATSIARRVGMPRRTVTILEGEGLVNDATALVLLRTTIAAIGGSVTVWEVAQEFILSVLGGIAVGLVVAFVMTRVRKRVEDDLTDIAISLLTPWIAYLPAEKIHASGVLAVVIAGLILGHRSPVIQSATSRVFERTNWATIQFVLENSVFFLIGLQVRTILDNLASSSVPAEQIAVGCVASLLAVIGLRIAWVFPATYLPRMIPAIGRRDPNPSWRDVAIVAWSGMRGVVTLAAVFLLPEDIDHREVYVAVAFFVTVGTLLLQGLTLSWVVRVLGVQGPDPAEDHLQEASIYQRAARAGLESLEANLTGDEPDEVVERLRTRSLDRANAVWERLGNQLETPSLMYARLRTQMLRAEREEVIQVRKLGLVDQEVLRHVLDALDVEETVLDLAREHTTENREEDLRAPEFHTGCTHLREHQHAPKPLTPEGCEGCLRDGSSWVHLRLCMDCGHIGCCDSSPQKHSDAHWKESGHAVIRSFETGEAWRWCFEHQLLG